jgi:HAT1-interacting factor 1
MLMMIQNYLVQVEELKTSPNESLTTSAPALAAQALDRELNAGPSSSSNTKATVVNDLTSIVVKKKKKVLGDSNAGKRKADEEAEPLNVDKKPKLEFADQ